MIFIDGKYTPIQKARRPLHTLSEQELRAAIVVPARGLRLLARDGSVLSELEAQRAIEVILAVVKEPDPQKLHEGKGWLEEGYRLIKYHVRIRAPFHDDVADPVFDMGAVLRGINFSRIQGIPYSRAYLRPMREVLKLEREALASRPNYGSW